MLKTIVTIAWIVVLALIVGGCNVSHTVVPDHKDLVTTRDTLNTHIDNAQNNNKAALDFLKNAVDLLNLGRPASDVKPPVQKAQEKVVQSNIELAAAKAQVEVLTQQTEKLEQKIAEQAADSAKLQDQLSTVTKEKASAIQATKDMQAQRDAARKKYDDAWFGGRTWRLIFWVSGISVLLLIAGLILNIHTDIFVWPLKIVGWVLTPKS